MQEIKKRTIVIASVLKPVDDTRMSEKIAATLCAKGDVHVIGFPVSHAVRIDGVTVHPITPHPFKRLSMKRLTAPLRFFRLALGMRPTDLIVCTHELLVPAVALKLLTGCRVIYDVQENYLRNILYTNAFPLILRPFLAVYVRLKEFVLSPVINHFLLAEASYKAEMSFPEKKVTVLENKFMHRNSTTVEKKSKRDALTHLIFSGTLSEASGVYTAIDVATKLHDADRAVRLTIIGHASRPEDLRKIRNMIEGRSFITMSGGDSLVPHETIVREIQASDFGIISYPPNPATSGSIPTKLFEYLANVVPVILIDNPHWVKLCAPFPAAVVFSTPLTDALDLLHRMRNTSFYNIRPEGVTWGSEAPRLLRLF